MKWSKLEQNFMAELAVLCQEGHHRKSQGDLAGQEACYERAMLAWEALFIGRLGVMGDTPRTRRKVEVPGCLPSMQLVAECRTRRGDLVGAETVLRRGLEIARHQMHNDRHTVEFYLHLLGKNLIAQGKFYEAEKLARQQVRLNARILNGEPANWAMQLALFNLAQAQHGNGRLADAAATARRALNIDNVRLYPEMAEKLAEILGAGGDTTGAASAWQKCAQLRANA